MGETDNVAGLVQHLWRHPSTIQSDLARRLAWPIALAASHGLISVGDDRRWRPTSLGLLFVHL